MIDFIRKIGISYTGVNILDFNQCGNNTRSVTETDKLSKFRIDVGPLLARFEVPTSASPYGCGPRRKTGRHGFPVVEVFVETISSALCWEQGYECISSAVNTEPRRVPRDTVFESFFPRGLAESKDAARSPGSSAAKKPDSLLRDRRRRRWTEPTNARFHSPSRVLLAIPEPTFLLLPPRSGTRVDKYDRCRRMLPRNLPVFFFLFFFIVIETALRHPWHSRPRRTRGSGRFSALFSGRRALDDGA